MQPHFLAGDGTAHECGGGCGQRGLRHRQQQGCKGALRRPALPLYKVTPGLLGQTHCWTGWACFQSGWLLQETEPVGAMHAAAAVTSSSIRPTIAADVDGVIAAALDVASLQ